MKRTIFYYSIMSKKQPLIEEDEDSNEDISLDESVEEENDMDEETDLPIEKVIQAPKKRGPVDEEEEEEEDYEDKENYLQKFDQSIKSNIITEYHQELKTHSHEEVEMLCHIERDELGNIIDPNHQTLSILTKYEYTRLLGERAKQLSAGAEPLVKINDYIIDEYSIALMELKEKKLPFIIERPLPNGTSEFWKLADLEIIL